MFQFLFSHRRIEKLLKHRWHGAVSNQYLLDLSRLNWQIFRKDVQASSKRCLLTCACEMSSVIIKEGLFMQATGQRQIGVLHHT